MKRRRTNGGKRFCRSSVRRLGDPFSHWRELVPLLRRTDCAFAYTEMYRDARVTFAGKTPLTLSHFHPGFGARCARRAPCSRQ